MKRNDAFMDHVETIVNETRDLLYTFARFNEGDRSDHARYCKSIALLCTDSVMYLTNLHANFLRAPEHMIENFLSEATYRMHSAYFLAGIDEDGAQEEAALRSITTKMEHADILLHQNPSDWTKFENAFNQLDNLRITSVDPND
jgi:hypothetical protein